MPLLLVVVIVVVVLALLLAVVVGVAVVMFAVVVVVVVVSVCAVCSLGFVRIIGVNYGQVRQPVAAFMPRLLLRHHPSHPVAHAGTLQEAPPHCAKVCQKNGRQKERKK